MQDTVVILEVRILPRPRPHCPACDIFVPWAVLDLLHPETALCAQGEEMNRRRLAEEEDWVGAVT